MSLALYIPCAGNLGSGCAQGWSSMAVRTRSVDGQEEVSVTKSNWQKDNLNPTIKQNKTSYRFAFTSNPGKFDSKRQRR